MAVQTLGDFTLPATAKGFAMKSGPNLERNVSVLQYCVNVVEDCRMIPITCRYYDYPFVTGEYEGEHLKLDVVHGRCPDQMSPCGMLPIHVFQRFGIHPQSPAAFKACYTYAQDLLRRAVLWFVSEEHGISRYAYIDIESALGTTEEHVRYSCNVVAQVITQECLFHGFEVYYNSEGFYGRRPLECVAVPPGSPIICDGEHSKGTLFVVNSCALNTLTLFPQLKRIARLIEVDGLGSEDEIKEG